MDPVRGDVRRRYALAALLTTAFVVRVAAVVVLGDPAGQPTTYEHGEIANNLLAGRGFTVTFLGSEGRTSQQAPWVPLLLAACAWPVGQVTPGAVFAFQLIQCAAGVALVAASARLAWNLFPQRRGIGWVTGWGVALFPPLVYMSTHVQAAPWSALGLTTLFAIVAKAHAAARPRTAVLAGLVTGWLVLVDPIFVIVAPIAAWQIFAACGTTIRSGWRPAALYAACAAVFVAPWIARNVAVHGEFVFVKSTFGYAFWQGNNAASWGTDKIPKPSAALLAATHDGSIAARNRALWEARHETLYIDDVLLKPGGYREFDGMSEPERSRLLGREAWQYVAEHPADYARRCLRRLRYFLLWDETNPKAMSLAYRASSAVWLALAGIGLLAARRHWRVLAPTLLAFAAIAGFHVLTITSARFRIPLEPFGLLWAAVGFEPAVKNLTRHVSRAWREARAAEVAEAAAAATPRGHGLAGPHLGKARRSVPTAARRR